MKQLIAGTLLLAACAPVAEPARPRDDLTAELAGRSAGAAETCIFADSQTAIRIRDRRTLSYQRAGTVYVNRLPRDCFRAEPLSTLIIEGQSGRYCAGDRVRELESGASVPGPTCLLGEWVPYRRPS
jgi:hypothetical protein